MKKNDWSMGHGQMIRPDDDVTTQDEIDAFLSDILAVCYRHGLALSHEDGHGAFLVEPISELRADWIRAAYFRPKE